MARTKSPVAKSDSVKLQAAAERARRAASKKALHDASKAAAPIVAQADKQLANDAALARAEQDRVNRLATAEQDAEATGATLEATLADMGIDAQGNILAAEKTRYQGPMLALVAARKAYVKGANGNPHTNDELGNACAAFTREQVVQAMIAALKLPGNPYTQLNPGQQSMNLRNKARHALKSGTVTMDAIKSALIATSATSKA